MKFFRYSTVLFVFSAYVQSVCFNIDNYTTCTGTILQQETHKRCLGILEQYVELPSDSILRKYQEKFAVYVEIARQCNQANQISKANRILDFCQIAFDCHKMDCESKYAGVKEAVIDILNRPIEIGLCLIEGKYVDDYQASKIILDCLDIGFAYLKGSK